MEHKIYLSESYNPYYNVALEYELLKKEKGVSLYLWQNKKTVVIGRNQNIYEQCDLNFLKKEGILPVRRFSGGGAVYQDMGNINYSFFAEKKYFDEEKFQNIILNAFKKLDIDVEFSGRNDVLFDGKKISGQAYYEEDEKILYHGTILYNVDLDLLSKALTPSKLKLETKGIKSVRSRVVNLKENFPKLAIEDIKEAFVDGFLEGYNLKEAEFVRINENSPYDENLFQKLQSHEWLYGEEPNFNVKLEKHFNFGNVQILLNIESSRVKKVNIYTDSLENLDFTDVKKKILGMEFEGNEDEIWSLIF